MGRRKKPTVSKKSDTLPDRRKSAFFMVRIPDVFEEPLLRLAARHVTNVTDEVKAAVREYCERHQVWNPPADD
jgi:hypothetical protein